MKRFVGILLLVVSLYSYGSIPESPYSFPTPSFKRLLPIPEVSKDLIIKNKIWSVIKTGNDRYGKYKHQFHFNSDGLVYKSEKSFDYDSTMHMNCNYYYDKKNRLIKKVKNEWSDDKRLLDVDNYNYTFIDTLAYSENGQLIFHKHYDNHRTNDVTLQSFYKVKVIDSIRILSDSLSPYFNYHLNRNDDVTKVTSMNRIDSIYTDIKDSNTFSKYYLYNHSRVDDSLYIKRIDNYENGRLVEKIVNGMLNVRIPFYHSKLFYMDSNLIRVEKMVKLTTS